MHSIHGWKRIQEVPERRNQQREYRAIINLSASGTNNIPISTVMFLQ